MRYKFSIITLTLILIITMTGAIAEDYDSSSTISIIIVGEEFNFNYLRSDAAPILKKGHTLVPIRAIMETLGFNVEWLGDEQIITITRNDVTVILSIGKTQMIINNEVNDLPLEPETIEGITFVPIRAIMEAFSFHIIWKLDSNNNSFIWIAKSVLLTTEDVIPNDNYHVLEEDVPYYVLNTDGITYRGIKIGDDYSKVVSEYGIPHKQDNENHLEYYTHYIPTSDYGSKLIFTFTENVVSSIEIDYGGCF